MSALLQQAVRLAVPGRTLSQLGGIVQGVQWLVHAATLFFVALAVFFVGILVHDWTYGGGSSYEHPAVAPPGAGSGGRTSSLAFSFAEKLFVGLVSSLMVQLLLKLLVSQAAWDNLLRWLESAATDRAAREPALRTPRPARRAASPASRSLAGASHPAAAAQAWTQPSSEGAGESMWAQLAATAAVALAISLTIVWVAVPDLLTEERRRATAELVLLIVGITALALVVARVAVYLVVRYLLRRLIRQDRRTKALHATAARVIQQQAIEAVATLTILLYGGRLRQRI